MICNGEVDSSNTSRPNVAVHKDPGSITRQSSMIDGSPQTVGVVNQRNTEVDSEIQTDIQMSPDGEISGSEIEFEGDPCGQHGPYTFYRSLRYKTSHRWRSLRLGQFFHARIATSSNRSMTRSTSTNKDTSTLGASSSANINKIGVSSKTGETAIVGSNEMNRLSKTDYALIDCNAVEVSAETDPTLRTGEASISDATKNLEHPASMSGITQVGSTAKSDITTNLEQPASKIGSTMMSGTTKTGEARTVSMVGEVQLLWEDKNRDGVRLASVRLYFLPEHSSHGRNTNHGKDELFTEDEKFIIKLEELLKWISDDPLPWNHNTLLPAQLKEALSSCTVSTSDELDLLMPYAKSAASKNHEMETQDSKTENTAKKRLSFEKHATESLTNGNYEKINEKSQQKVVATTDEDSFQLIILSYPQYCRLCAIIKRLDGVSLTRQMATLAAMLLSSIRQGLLKGLLDGGTVVFCRDTAECSVLQDHPSRLTHLAPVLKGRKRKKKIMSRSAESTDSNESETSSDRNSSHKAKPLKNPVGRPAGNKKSMEAKEEEKFLKRLYDYMKGINSPISRVPVLGFKELNLYQFYQYTQSLGGYQQVTKKRLWKKVYDQMGGCPGNTSAATGTRQNYEKLLLPFEDHLAHLEENKKLTRLGKQLQHQQKTLNVQNQVKIKKLAVRSDNTSTTQSGVKYDNHSIASSPTSAKKPKLEPAEPLSTEIKNSIVKSTTPSGETKIDPRPFSLLTPSYRVIVEKPSTCGSIKEIKRDIKTEINIRPDNSCNGYKLSGGHLKLEKEEKVCSVPVLNTTSVISRGPGVKNSLSRERKHVERKLSLNSDRCSSSYSDQFNLMNQITSSYSPDVTSGAVSASLTSRRLLSGSKMVYNGFEPSGNSMERVSATGKSNGSYPSGKSDDILGSLKRSAQNGSYCDVISLSSNQLQNKTDSRGNAVKSVYANSQRVSSSVASSSIPNALSHGQLNAVGSSQRSSLHRDIMGTLMAGQGQMSRGLFSGATPSGGQLLVNSSSSGDSNKTMRHQGNNAMQSCTSNSHDQPTDLSMKTLKKQEKDPGGRSRAGARVASMSSFLPQDEPLNLSAKPRESSQNNLTNRSESHRSRSDRHSTGSVGYMSGHSSGSQGRSSGSAGHRHSTSRSDYNGMRLDLGVGLGSGLANGSLSASGLSGFPSGYEAFSAASQNPSMPQLAAQLLPLSMMPSLYASQNFSQFFSNPSAAMLPTSLHPGLANSLPPGLANSGIANSLPPGFAESLLGKCSDQQLALMAHPAFAAAAAARENPAAAAAMLAAGLGQFELLQAAAAAAAAGNMNNSRSYRE